jgi:hypothetical protein
MIASRALSVAIAATFVIAAAIPAAITAQTPAAPERPASWTPPRTPDGQPDIQGFWANQTKRLATYDIEGPADPIHVLMSGNPTDPNSLVIDPADGKIPYQPWARAKRQDTYDNHKDPTSWDHVDPHTLCWLSGIPRMFYQGMTQILQTPGYVIVLQEFNHAYRIIHLDGRPHIPANLKLFMGDSRGRWEGHTLHVEVSSKNDKTWFDMVGDFYSDAVRIRERFTPIEPDRIRYEATFDDPKVYARPFTIGLTLGRTVKGEDAKTYGFLEEACREGERNIRHMLFRFGDRPMSR